MRTNKLHSFGDSVILWHASMLWIRKQQAAKDAVNTLGAIHLTHIGTAQSGNDLRHLLLYTPIRNRTKSLPAAAERDNLRKK